MGMETFNGFQSIPYIFLALGIAAIIGGVMSLSVGEFGETINEKCLNSSFSIDSTGDKCLNNSVFAYDVDDLADKSNLSLEYYALEEGQDSLTTVASQLGTVGIIGIMVIIIGLLASVFVYFKYFR